MSQIDRIKKTIKNNIGTKCSILFKQGRKKILFENCTLETAYPEIFVVKYFDAKQKKEKNVSFSYIDLLTKTVCIAKSGNQPSEKGA